MNPACRIIFWLAAKASGQGLAQYVRHTTAVLRRWDPGMYHLILVRLDRSVYAFRGGISPQNEASRYMNPKDLDHYKKRFTKPVLFGGGNGQVYIPGLGTGDVSMIVPEGAVNIYDDIDPIIESLIDYKVI